MKSVISSPWLDTQWRASIEIEGRPRCLKMARNNLGANSHAEIKVSFQKVLGNEKSPPRDFDGDFS